MKQKQNEKYNGIDVNHSCSAHSCSVIVSRVDISKSIGTNKRNMLYQTVHIQHTENKRLEMIWFGFYMKRLPIVNPHHVQLITLHAFVKINAYNAVIRALY